MYKFEQREVDGPSNVGLFALEDIPKQNVICRESPFYSFNRENIMHYMMNENPTSDPILDAEIRYLQTQIRLANEKYQRQKLSFEDEYPPNVRVLLDRMLAIIAEKSFTSESREVQEKWMALNDAHKQVRKDSTVGICGLQSENGKRFNGKIAHCSGFDNQKDRYIIECKTMSNKSAEKILLKKQNLKTVSGIFRSNSFQEGLFETRCRMNHSCLPNTLTCTLNEYNEIFGKELIADTPNECITVAKRDIKAGDQLTLSYLFLSAGKDVKGRREELREKYRFNCCCDACIREEKNS